MASILKVDTIQDQDGNNIISENANVITIGASGDTITVPAGVTVSGFTSAGIDDNATSTAITIDSSQNVGIGATTPSFKLEVKDGVFAVRETNSSSSPDIRVINDVATQASLRGAGTTRTNPGTAQGMPQLVAFSGYDLFIGADGNDDIAFTTNRSERMRITSTGLGIGTTSPEHALDVISSNSVPVRIRSTASVNMQVEIDAPTGYNSNILFKENDASKWYIGNEASTDSLRFYDGTANAERMRITSDGSVGINTNSPNALLDLGGAGSSFQSGAEKITIAAAPSPYTYYPSLSSHNRSYLHLTGSGGGSAFNTSIHGYQVANPAGGSYMRVASGLTNNYVLYHKTDVTGFKWYADYNKSSGDADFTPSEEVSFNFETDTGAIVFNESSRDRDFRVESNNDSHMLFVDGGQDAVAIGSGDVFQSAKLNVTQLDGNKPIQHLRGDDVVGGQIRSMKILKHVPVVSLGTKLIIPFISQSSWNTSSLITLRGKTAVYNTSIPKAFEVVFQIGHLTSLSNFSVLRSGGTYSSATTNGMNVEIIFNTNYTNATQNGVMIEMDILCERMQYSVDIDAIVMN